MTAIDINGGLNYESVLGLEYLDSVVSETLRLYPPGQRLGFICVNDYRLKSRDITLTKGLNIEVSIVGLHRSEEYFPSAHKFHPDRFMPENRHNIIPNTYLPFGAGRRLCIGIRFALMEIKLTLAHLVLNYQLSRSSKTDVPPSAEPQYIVYCPRSICLNIRMR